MSPCSKHTWCDGVLRFCCLMYLLAKARFMQSATLFLLYVMIQCSYWRPAIQYVFVSVIRATGMKPHSLRNPTQTHEHTVLLALFLVLSTVSKTSKRPLIPALIYTVQIVD